MRTFTTVLLSSLILAGASATASAEVLVNIDKGSQTMTVTVDGQQRYTWPVSTGVRGHDTPSGTFKPFRMEATHFSREWDNAPMPYSTFFTKVGHAIHGTSHVKNLGRAASHGCVRLSPGNAATLFTLIKQQGMSNTQVVVQGGEPAVVAEEDGVPPAAGRRRGNPYIAGGVMPAGMQMGRSRGYDPYAAPQRRGYQADPYAGGYGYAPPPAPVRQDWDFGF